MNDVINIFENIPDHIPEELFQEILKTKNLKVERIVSKGHSSEDDHWYDQEENEWVILLKGNAGLLFEGDENVVILKPGDYINIPSHTKHRVEWTDPNIETVWLAIYYKGLK
ncbi:MAG: cupin domain-containing protein [Thermodesulfobacteriota bacterium]|nr:cupin domain-containing protein [Thermodesulfobacteriota bacterium]